MDTMGMDGLTEQEEKRLEMFEHLLEREFTYEELGLTLVALIDHIQPNASVDQFKSYCDLIKSEYDKLTAEEPDLFKLN